MASLSVLTFVGLLVLAGISDCDKTAKDKLLQILSGDDEKITSEKVVFSEQEVLKLRRVFRYGYPYNSIIGRGISKPREMKMTIFNEQPFMERMRNLEKDVPTIDDIIYKIVKYYLEEYVKARLNNSRWDSMTDCEKDYEDYSHNLIISLLGPTINEAIDRIWRDVLDIYLPEWIPIPPAPAFAEQNMTERALLCEYCTLHLKVYFSHKNILIVGLPKKMIHV